MIEFKSFLHDLTGSEEKFYSYLAERYIGVDISGDSGLINYFRLKNHYFRSNISTLKSKIDKELGKIKTPSEVLFEGLLDFLVTSLENQSINVMDLINNTPFLYFRLPLIIKNMNVRINDNNFLFEFNNTNLKHLRSKDNINLNRFVYSLKKTKNNNIFIDVIYSRRKRKNDLSKLLEQLKEIGITISMNELKYLVKLFEKQLDINFIIFKDLKGFLKKRFMSWYIDQRIIEVNNDNLLVLSKLIDIIGTFMANFDETLLKILTEENLIIKDFYILPLGLIQEKDRKNELINLILSSDMIASQVDEWKQLKLVNNDFKIEQIVKEGKVASKWLYLPIDTAIFSDIEFKLLKFVNDINNDPNGWLINADNLLALLALSKQFNYKNKIDLMYIDPPFNTGDSKTYDYTNKFESFFWTALLMNRLEIAKEILSPTGSFYTRIDYRNNYYIRLMLNKVFGESNFKNEIIIKRTEGKSRAEGLSFSVATESLFFYTKGANYYFTIPKRDTDVKIFSKEFIKRLKKVDKILFDKVSKIYDEIFWLDLDHRPGIRSTSSEIVVYGLTFPAPKGRHWIYNQKRINEAIKQKRVRIKCLACNTHYQRVIGKSCPLCQDNKFIVQIFYDKESLTNDWTDLRSYAQSNFPTGKFSSENSELLLKRVLESSSRPGDLVMDFFLGSGTTVAVAHKMGRKWIGIEIGDHFKTVVLPRMKAVIAGDKKGISREVGWSGGGFLRYSYFKSLSDILKEIKVADFPLL